MSRRTDAGWENLADKLPFQPCGDLQNDVLEDIYDNDMLGTGLMLYSRESVETANPIAQIMDAEDWDRWEKSRKRRWGARCTCSNCGEEFFAGYVSDSGTSGIVLRQGEDGQIYDGYVDKGDDDAQIFFDDETIVCPRCYQSVVVTRRSELRQGRTLQALQAETLNIDNYLNMCGNYSMLRDAPNIPWVDWSETKPHRMLGMSKEAFREVRGKHWSEGTARCWASYRMLVKNADALQFVQEVGKLDLNDMEKLLGAYRAVETDLHPTHVVKYLEKQKRLKGGVQLLLDYRCVLRALWLADQNETLWPRDLQAAHDRVMEMYAAHEGVKYYSADFTPVYIRLKALEWTDGELCIRIPQEERELIDEGKTLRHCVGTYGRTHCSGKPIFFVRHYRRPERSYYTLNIDLTRAMPKEIQLHGYGNERHGERKQYEHGIPKKVRDFCDRWEREVLTPWFMEEQRKKFAETNKVDKKARKGA